MKEDDWIDVFVNDPSIVSMKIAADWFEEQGDAAAQLLRWMIKMYENATSDTVYKGYMPTPAHSILNMRTMWWWTHYFPSQAYYHYDLPTFICDLANNYYYSPQEAWKAALRACREVIQRDGCIE